jgi:hypothetical protein
MAVSSPPQPHAPVLSPEAHQHIEHLVREARERPDSAAAFVELSRAYAELWTHTSARETFARVERGLERSIDLDGVVYAGQIREILDYVADHARSQSLVADAAKRVRALEKRLQSRIAAAAQKASLTVPTPEPEVPPAAHEPLPPPPWASALGPSPFAAAPAPLPPAEPQPALRTLPHAPGSQSGGPVAGPALAGPASFAAASLMQEDEMGRTDEDFAPQAWESGKNGADEVHPSAVADPELIRQIDGLFVQKQIDAVLQLYARLADPRLKRYVIGQFAEKISDYRVAPLLAIGAMESDKRVFRHMISLLLSGDRARICQQIDLAQLAPELRQMGVVVLCQMKSRAALPKLQKALAFDDPVVRCVALRGIGSAGAAAEALVPLLVTVARADPDPRVREDAAKAIAATGLVQAYDALQAVALEAHLDQPVLKVLETMRAKFDPSGSRLARKVAALRRKPEQVDGVTSQKLRHAEAMLASRERMLQRAKERAARDPEVIAAKKRREALTKALIYFVVFVLPAAYLCIRYLWPILHAIASKVTEGPHYND